MNTSIRTPSKGGWSRRKQRSGIALLLVLAGVTLAAVLVVSLLFLVKSGRVVSGAYAGQVQTRVLANTALNLAIGQIRDATADTSMAETWSSQPGVIRVYSNANSASSTVDNFVKGYKLYSSSLMTVSGSANEALLTQDVEQDGNPVPTTWAQEPGQYVNLNQPVNGVYPIVDPNVLPNKNSTPAGNPNSPNGVTSTSGVEGFSDTDASITGNDITTGNYPNLAMPVEWLYQLQDGTLVPGVYQAGGANKGAVQVGGSITHAGNTITYEAPTAANPIVARVAFWSDDESSKVNINTASEGMYWDEPRVNTQIKASDITTGNNSANFTPASLMQVFDYAADPSLLTTPQGPLSANAFKAIGTDQAYGANQPAANEFNRFPGHPATTSLSAVFSELSPQQIFSILPRYSLNGVSTVANLTTRGSGTVITNCLTSSSQYTYSGSLTGGSVMGTLPWIYYASLSAILGSYDLNFGSNDAYNPTVSLNPNRLYATSGEVMLQPNRTANGGLTTAMLQQRKFFLTSDSTAPELNLFGCPRVSMWPVNGHYDPQATPSDPGNNGLPYTTAYDKSTAFCSTLQPSGASAGTEYPYYFKRESAYSQTADATLLTNPNLYTYLQTMTGKAVPGFGGNFSAKFGVDDNQIVTEMLDYIRCTNLFDTSLEFNSSGVPSSWVSGGGLTSTVGNEFTNGAHGIYQILQTGGYPGYGQVLPLLNGTNMGLGRTYTVSQVSVHFICTGDYMEGGQGPGASGGTPSNVASNVTLNSSVNGLLTSVPSGSSNPTSWQKEIQAIILIELATPMQGYPTLSPSIGATVSFGSGPFASPIKVAATSGSVNLTIANPAPIFTYNDATAGASTYSYGTMTSREGANPVGALLWEGIGACGYGSFFPFTAMGYSADTGMTATAATAEPKSLNISLATLVPSNSVPYTKIPLYTYSLISAPFRVNVTKETAATPPTMSVTWPASGMTIKLFYATDGNGHGNATATAPYQTINVPLPFSSTIPVPNLVQNAPNKWILSQGTCGIVSQNSGQGSPSLGTGRLAIIGTGLGTGNNQNSYLSSHGGISSAIQEFIQGQTQNYPPTGTVTPIAGGNTDVVRSVAVVDGDFRINAAMSPVPTTRFAAVGGSAAATDSTTYALQTLTTPYVAIQSYPWPLKSPHGQTCSYKVDVSNPSMDGTDNTAARPNAGSYVSGVTMPAFCTPEVPSTATYPAGVAKPSDTGDWDNGLAGMPDGPFANMADAGNTLSSNSNYQISNCNPTIPYFDQPTLEGAGVETSFSPNRQVPSPGMFGSLPTGVARTTATPASPKPWQTLRFRPQSNTAGQDFTPNYSLSIPDYLFMDLFWMPVVQPYAISQPFSTAGKINMNYQILPFSYIKRQTGLYAVLKNERMLCVPSTASTTYKADTTAAAAQTFAAGSPSPGAVQGSDAVAWRHMINVPATLAQFDGLFSTGQIFRSAAQICDQYIVPLNGDAPSLNGSSSAATVQSSMQTYWSGELLTGDNSRERPYSVIYPRLTTQSNTYRVHYWVQSLKKASSSNQAYFVDPNSTAAAQHVDSIGGQLRGSFLIERYLQGDDSRLASWGGSNYPTPTANLNSYYKIRILGSTDFSPQ